MFPFQTLPLRDPDCSEPAVPWTLLEPRELGVLGHAKYCLVPAIPEMVIGLIELGDSGPSHSVWLSRRGGTPKVLTLNLGSHHAITQDYLRDRPRLLKKMTPNGERFRSKKVESTLLYTLDALETQQKKHRLIIGLIIHDSKVNSSYSLLPSLFSLPTPRKHPFSNATDVCRDSMNHPLDGEKKRWRQHVSTGPISTAPCR